MKRIKRISADKFLNKNICVLNFLLQTTDCRTYCRIYTLNLPFITGDSNKRVLTVIAAIIIIPPIIAGAEGISPYPINTQTGLRTGSISDISEASIASIRFRPLLKNVYASAIWNTPRNVTIHKLEKESE